MRFPHNTKIFRGQLDAAPFVGVFFLLVIFLLFNSGLVFTPGVPIRLPEADGLPAADNATADTDLPWFRRDDVIGIADFIAARMQR